MVGVWGLGFSDPVIEDVSSLPWWSPDPEDVAALQVTYEEMVIFFSFLDAACHELHSYSEGFTVDFDHDSLERVRWNAVYSIFLVDDIPQYFIAPHEVGNSLKPSVDKPLELFECCDSCVRRLECHLVCVLDVSLEEHGVHDNLLFS